MGNTNSRDMAYQNIKRRIINLDLKPGECLSDKELAEEMGVSRTPVREALIMLSLADLVVVRPQSSTFVSPIDLEIVEMEQFTRCTLEKEMIRTACHHMTPEDESRYRENLHLYEFYEQLNVAGREEKLLKLDNEFHRIAFIINGKGKYYDRMHSSMQHIERLRILSLRAVNDDRICTDHQKIAQAVLDKDATIAEQLLESHMNLYVEHLIDLKYKIPEYFKEEPI